MLPITLQFTHSPRGRLWGVDWNKPFWGHRQTTHRKKSPGNGETCAR